MRFLRAHTEIYSQMASWRLLISNPEQSACTTGRHVPLLECIASQSYFSLILSRYLKKYDNVTYISKPWT